MLQRYGASSGGWSDLKFSLDVSQKEREAVATTRGGLPGSSDCELQSGPGAIAPTKMMPSESSLASMSLQ